MRTDHANELISGMNGIQLHGHIHSDENYNIRNRDEGILRYDVGVDANQFLPVSVQQILSFINL